ncbi:hypothetical protein E3O21_10005 [Cryobacterium flavum]|nr:hypothetical protein [Cryobacterium flavum]TFB77213.1 hypothetical protein E3O21_10005 [Cryobacterium flavum]
MASLAVIPSFALAGFVMLSWLAALIYRGVADFSVANPFSVIWEPYDFMQSLPILFAAVSGLLCASVFPSRGPTVADLTSAFSGQFVAQWRTWFLVSVAIAAMLVFAKGEYLFEADSYLQFDRGGTIASVANILTPVSLVAAGLVAARKRILGIAITASLMVIIFGYGSRMLAVAPLLHLLGTHLAGAHVRVRVWISALAASIILLPIPLFSRTLPVHGLIAYWEGLWSNLSTIYLVTLPASLGNIGFTAPLAAHVSKSAPIPIEAFFASLDPRLSDGTSWDEWAPILRVHTYIPYSMMGEWANLGLPALFIAMLGWGLVSRACITLTALDRSALGRASMIAVVGLCALSALYSTQYNTRSVNRLITIMILITIMAFVRAAVARQFRYSTAGKVSNLRSSVSQLEHRPPSPVDSSSHSPTRQVSPPPLPPKG